MDKYEYNVKLEQIKKLIKKKDYATAARIADTIDWYKVKNNQTIVMIADVYEASGRYEQSKENLKLAYDRSGLGRQIAYKLVKICIKCGALEEAEDFYDDFVSAAPRDISKYLLQYELAKAKGDPLDSQISILEQYLEEDMDDKWAFELAKLYHKSGQRDKCIQQCDTVMLWFSDGKYVEKAMELKMIYTPLTKSQRERYEARWREKSGQTETGVNAEEIRIKEMDVSNKYNTQNIQNALKESMDELYSEEEKKKNKSGSVFKPVPAKEEEYQEDYPPTELYEEAEETASGTDDYIYRMNQGVRENSPASGLGRGVSGGMKRRFEQDFEEQAERAYRDDLGDTKVFVTTNSKRALGDTKVFAPIRQAMPEEVSFEEPEEEPYILEERTIKNKGDKVWKEVQEEISDEVWEEPSDEMWAEPADENAGEMWIEEPEDTNEMREDSPEESSNEIWAEPIDENADEMWEEAQEEASDEIWAEPIDENADEMWEEAQEEPSDEMWAEPIDENAGEMWEEVQEEPSDEIWVEAQEESSDAIWVETQEESSDEMWGKLQKEDIDEIEEKIQEESSGEMWEIPQKQSSDEVLKGAQAENVSEIQAEQIEEAPEDLSESEAAIEEILEESWEEAADEISKELYEEHPENTWRESQEETKDEMWADVQEEAAEEILKEQERLQKRLADEIAEELQETAASEENILKEKEERPISIDDFFHFGGYYPTYEEDIEESEEDIEEPEIDYPLEESEEPESEEDIEEPKIDYLESELDIESEEDIEEPEIDYPSEEDEEPDYLELETVKDEEPDYSEPEIVKSEYQKPESEIDYQEAEYFKSDSAKPKVEYREPEPQSESADESDIEEHEYEELRINIQTPETEDFKDIEDDEIKEPEYEELKTVEYENYEEPENSEEYEDYESYEEYEELKSVPEDTLDSEYQYEETEEDEPNDDYNEYQELKKDTIEQAEQVEEEKPEPEDNKPEEDSGNYESVDSFKIDKTFSGGEDDRALTHDEIKSIIKDFIGKYSGVQGLDKQMLRTLQNIIVENNCNIFIMGDAKSGKTSLGLDIIKVVNKIKRNNNRKIAKISADKLVGKALSVYFTRLMGSDIYIENISLMDDDTLNELFEVMDKDEDDRIVVIEDEKANAERFLEKHKELGRYFLNRIIVKQNRIKDWVEIAREYAEEQGYEIDEIGLLALHAKIDELYGVTLVIQKNHVESVIDSAIKRANKGGIIKKLLAKRKEKILTEEHFS